MTDTQDALLADALRERDESRQAFAIATDQLVQMQGDLREARNIITLLQMDLDVASCLAEELQQARAENAKLRQATWKVLNIIPTPTCDQMHHTKKEQHEYGAICPPVERVKSIIDNCKKLLA